ncbi:MAG: hypothetical protein ABSE62_01075 [Chthoniobacteraceae bacterium]|jgi:hypothetical protein
MKLPFTTAFVMAGLAASACADQNVGTALVTNNHGGYNVIQPGATASIGFFGPQGYAANVVAHSHDYRPNFVLQPVVEDMGHGNKVVVYKKIYFATPEDAAAAKARIQNGITVR